MHGLALLAGVDEGALQDKFIASMGLGRVVDYLTNGLYTSWLETVLQGLGMCGGRRRSRDGRGRLQSD